MRTTKLLRSKKGFNDMFLLYIIILIFVFTATFIPFINDAFNTNAGQFDADGTLRQVQQDAQNVTTFNAFEIMITMLKLAVWDPGNSLGLPFWLDAFFITLSAIFVLVVARNLWIGGGG